KMTNVITVNDLRLTNGLIGNFSTGGNPPIGRLAGNITVQTNGEIDAGGSGAGFMQILATISGSGGLTIVRTNTVILSAHNPYNGAVTVLGSTLELDGSASMTPSSLTLENAHGTFKSGGINGTGTTWTNNVVTNIVLAGGNLNVGYGSAGVL